MLSITTPVAHTSTLRDMTPTLTISLEGEPGTQGTSSTGAVQRKQSMCTQLCIMHGSLSIQLSYISITEHTLHKSQSTKPAWFMLHIHFMFIMSLSFFLLETPQFLCPTDTTHSSKTQVPSSLNSTKSPSSSSSSFSLGSFYSTEAILLTTTAADAILRTTTAADTILLTTTAADTILLTTTAADAILLTTTATPRGSSRPVYITTASTTVLLDPTGTPAIDIETTSGT